MRVTVNPAEVLRHNVGIMETTAAVSAAVAVIERAEAQRPGATTGMFSATQSGRAGAAPSIRPTVSPTNPDGDRDRGRG